MTQFETTCPNEHSVKFTLEMCGRTAQCPKCSARFEVPKLSDVREMLGDEIDADLEAEFRDAEVKLKELAKARAARRAQLEREAAEKLAREKDARETAEKAEREAQEAAEREAREAAEKEAREKAEREAREAEEKAKREAEENARREAEEKARLEAEAEEEQGEMIVFLCPNGHELSAPVSRAGKKGKCPDCGAKFIVPTQEMLTEAAAPKEEPVSASDSKISDFRSDDTGEEIELTIEEPSAESASPSAAARKISLSKDADGKAFLYPNLAMSDAGGIDVGLDDVRQMIPEALRMDPMAKFFWTLWTSPAKNEDGMETPAPSGCSAVSGSCKAMNNIIGEPLPSARSGRIEIQTADGKAYRPVTFYEDKSLSPIGFFDALDADGNTVVLVIRWENVVRIVVK